MSDGEWNEDRYGEGPLPMEGDRRLQEVGELFGCPWGSTWRHHG